MRAVFLLAVLLVFCSRAHLLPLHLRYPASRNRIAWQKKSVGEENDVLWGHLCSPRLAWLQPQQDARLQCEIFGPTGTILTWYKDQVPINPQQMEAVEEATNSVAWKGKTPRATPTGVSKVRVRSTVYIDCASTEDMGEYSLKVQTPDHRVFTRNFTVTFTSDDGANPGPTCGIGKALVTYLPRIYQYAPQALAHIGHDITLPCRQQGQDSAVTWFLHNSPLPQDSSKYLVLSNGDLVVRRVNTQDRGMYKCRVASTLVNGLFDQIRTFLYPML
ncbi:zwei Ig domain protein zig-4-like [Penaeus japonicus]|uniref:zwei Ig domain protein zig-4-like n=1 Tax=Penaeus japonicus TaxID=27405 RepID=UPI001C70D121|nr:zwei Ig domain protein zig-4-like [Penaeus japonicus]